MSDTGLWNLPVGWCWSTFSTVATIASNLVSPVEWADKPHIAPDNIERDTGRLLAYRTIAEDSMTSPKHLFKPGQLLYSKIRPYLNKCVRISFHGLCSADMYPLDARIDAGYLHYYIISQQFVSDVTQAAGSRTVLPKTNQEQLSTVPVPVAPLLEQRRISELLDSYFSRLTETATLLDRIARNLKRYRASVLKAAVEGRLVPTEAALARQEGRDYEPASALLERILTERRRRWAESGKKGKYEEPMRPDVNNLLDLPEGWCWTTLGELKQFSLYGPRFSNEDYAAEGRLVLRTSDISPSGKVDIDSAPRIPLDDQEFEKYRVEIGDLLITRTGSLGTLAVFNDAVDAIPGAYLIQFRLAAPLQVAWFCFFFFKSPTGQDALIGGGAGVGRPNLNAPTIESIAIGLPPLAEQARIQTELERLLSMSDEVEAQVRLDSSRCQRLRQSILKWAFEGKLADQDPNDEPASVLLDRIKAERDTPKPAKKKTRP